MTTSDAESSVEPAPQSTSATDPSDVPHPLSEYVQGTLRIYFNDGAHVERRTAQADARAFLAMQNDDRRSDRVVWDSRAWFQWDRERVVFSSFDALRDQNWEISPDDRDALAAAGHPRGVVASLVDYWGRKDRRDEPLYSVNAVAALHHLALAGADRRTWEAAARVFEGRDGAHLLGRTPDQGPIVVPDDDAEPDVAHDDTSTEAGDRSSEQDASEVEPTPESTNPDGE